MAFNMKGSPARMGTIKGTVAHKSALRQVEEEKNLLERHEEWKTKRTEKRKAKIESGEIMGIKEKMQRKYGTGEYSRTDISKKVAMEPGESKYKYDIRTRKETPKREEEYKEYLSSGKAHDDFWASEEGQKRLGLDPPEGPPPVVVPNTYGTFDGDDWSKVDEVSGLNLQQVVDKRNKLVLAGNTESYEYSKAQEAINIANANKTKPWGKVETEKERLARVAAEKLEAEAAVRIIKQEQSKVDVVEEEEGEEVVQTEGIEAKIESLKRKAEEATNLTVMERGKIMSEIKKLQAELRR